MHKRFSTPLKNSFLVAAGTLLLSFGTALFILPFDLVVGGISGLSISLHRLVPALSTDRWIFLWTWALFLLGWALFGHRFAAKTLLSTALYPLAVTLFSRLADPTVAGGFFYLPAGANPQIAMLLSALFGGMLIGLGCAMTFLGGGSSGGVDILALALCRASPRIRHAAALFTIDALSLLLGALVLKDLTLTLLGIFSAFVSALAMDYLLKRN